MQTIKKINPKSAAHLYGYFTAVAGFITAMLMAVASIINVVTYEELTGLSILSTTIFHLLIGVLVGLMSAVAGLVVGYLSGYVIAWLYNEAARRKLIGGLKIEIE